MRIICADDNDLFRELLTRALSQYEIQAFADPLAALEALGKEAYPNLISDIQMPGLNGIELAERVWKLNPRTRILFVSNHNDEIYIRALEKIVPPGATYGYLLKSSSIPELRKAVNTVFEEEQCWFDKQVRSVQVVAKDSEQTLSDIEYEVMIDLALGLTDNMIARRYNLTRRGVQNRLNKLYRKLGVDQDLSVDLQTGDAINARTRAIYIALRRGLINVFELRKSDENLQAWLERQGRDQPEQ